MSFRHSVTQASTSGTASMLAYLTANMLPPFSNTGINEWHLLCQACKIVHFIRHSVTQASTSGTLDS